MRSSVNSQLVGVRRRGGDGGRRQKRQPREDGGLVLNTQYRFAGFDVFSRLTDMLLPLSLSAKTPTRARCRK